MFKKNEKQTENVKEKKVRTYQNVVCVRSTTDMVMSA